MDPPAHTKPDTAKPSQPHLTFVCWLPDCCPRNQ